MFWQVRQGLYLSEVWSLMESDSLMIIHIYKLWFELWRKIISLRKFSTFCRKRKSFVALKKMVWFSWGCSRKGFACQCRRCKRHGFDPWVRKISWSRKWQPPPVFLPENFHGQKSLVGYSPWGHRRVKHNWVTEHIDVQLIKMDQFSSFYSICQETQT